MSTPLIQTRLEAGETVTGMFAPAGADFATPGVLTWSAPGGALLELAGRDDPWPSDTETGFTVHGTPHEGDLVTLLDCGIRRWRFHDTVSHLSSSTFAIGEHTDNAEPWAKANFRPVLLHQWLPETGLSLDRGENEDDHDSFALNYNRPSRRVIEFDDDEVAIWAGADYTWAYSPDWGIKTTLTFGVTPEDALSMNGHYARFGHPLLGFCVFAADEADDLLLESYFNPSDRRRVAVLRAGRRPSRRQWRPRDERFLFRAEHVADVPGTIRRWVDVWHASSPALGLYMETIAESTYSAPRFLTLYTAAETYYRRLHAHRGPWSPRAFAELADLDPALTGATQNAVATIGQLRAYHAHGNAIGPGNGDDEHLLTFDATRRLQALFQVCVMRDIGIDTATIEERMKLHYRAWPLP